MTSWTGGAQFGANIATMVGVVGVFLAYRQLHTGLLGQREATTLGIWKDYLQLALTNPDLASPEPHILVEDRRSERYRKYEWFVSTMLFACEQVIALEPDDAQWRESVKDHLNIHRLYLCSPEFRPERYTLALRALITAVTRPV